MKATGIVRRVDDLGRIAIPKDIRRQIGISENSPMEIFIEDNTVVLRKYDTENLIKCRFEDFRNTFDGCREFLDNETAKAIEVHINALFGIMKTIKESED